MPSYLTPGVYIEEIASGAKPIEGVATSTAAFIGEARLGPVGEAVLVSSLGDYERTFGTVDFEGDALGLAVEAFFKNGGQQAYIARLVAGAGQVSAFADLTSNGTANRVLRIEASSPGAWGNDLYLSVELDARRPSTFTLVAGAVIGGVFTAYSDERHADLSMDSSSSDYVVARLASDSVRVRAVVTVPGDQAYAHGSLEGGTLQVDDLKAAWPAGGTGTLKISLDGRTANRISVAPALTGDRDADGAAIAAAITAAVRAMDAANEPYKSFTCGYDAADTQFTLTSGSALQASSVGASPEGIATDVVSLLRLASTTGAIARPGIADLVPVAIDGTASAATRLQNGAAASPGEDDFVSFFEQKLSRIRDANILLLPGHALPAGGTGSPIVDAAVAHCEAMKNRMVIVDPPETFELSTRLEADSLNAPTSTYTAMYYPWVAVANPEYDADLNPTADPTVYIAPSAFAAGMWAKTDAKRGVWKAPAGVETQLLGAQGLRFDVDDTTQAQLNPEGVNCLRRLGGYGRVIWGSRTRATRSAPEWRYVPVRRTAIFIEESIFNGIQWAVFEPNDHRLWSSLRVNIESFMNGLFRSGAFQGSKASDAYFVRCGLGDTMTQGDIDAGQVIVIVGFAPLKPAEFVIVRIQQKVGQQ